MGEISKSQVIEKLQSARAEWEALLTTVGAERLETPGVTGDWTVKDVLAHMNAWQSRPLAWIEAIRSGAKPAPPPWPRGGGDDETNAWIYEHNHARSASSLVAEWRETSAQLLAEIRALSEAQVTETKYEFLNDQTLAAALEGNTWEHAHEHAGYVREWLARQAQPA